MPYLLSKFAGQRSSEKPHIGLWWANPASLFRRRLGFIIGKNREKPSNALLDEHLDKNLPILCVLSCPYTMSGDLAKF
jgi:hypothetical protein